ncbi:WecB/TagA/CpsF family glycosyltransferase [Paraferrimonas haliotis]|uniref:Alpha-1,3-mannosyltransferase n=1 Tax=Paraferrimonas haliotis TaxID=2013866 RepID=A0AA37TXD1_9GAMM|nr:WecB/TagA/CpsF family glycosyltransferase [Paraferrimonas haliotis]GLS84594.1 hypothetical protein GCM10007894_25710 [Paraferrimonas haliotis]
MHIVHIVRQFDPAMGGLENFVKSLAQEQLKSGHSVTVITLNRVFHQQGSQLPYEAEIEGILVKRIGYVGSPRYPIALSIVGEIPSCDVVHVHAIDFFVDYLAVNWWRVSAPMVVSTHGGFFHSKFASMAKRLYFNTVTRLSLRAFQYVLACSNNDLLRFSKINQKRLLLIENGVDVSKFANAASPQYQPHFIFIGRFSDNKRLPQLIDTLSEVNKIGSVKVRLSIIGKDWDNNKLLLTEKISTLNAQGWVSIYCELADDEIRALVSSASYICSASEYEGFGLTILEGMAAGLIPVVSDIASFNRIIHNAKVGLITPFNDPAQDAKRIVQFCNHVSEQYQSLRSKAISASQEYSWSRVSKSFEQVYQQVNAQKKVIQGITVNDYSKQALLTQLNERLENRRSTILAFANAHSINTAQQSNEYLAVLNRSLTVNDGSGMRLASKLKYGIGFKDNLNGTDFVPYLLANLTPGTKLFLLGGEPGIPKECLNVWQAQYPQLNWVGEHHGYFNERQSQHICQTIKACKADIVIVALGNPLQELWLDNNLEKCGAILGIGVGALFDFTVGKATRAPHWMRALGVEWVYRLIKEPQRMWKRYLIGNFTFVLRSLRDAKR